MENRKTAKVVFFLVLLKLLFYFFNLILLLFYFTILYWFCHLDRGRKAQDSVQENTGDFCMASKISKNI